MVEPASRIANFHYAIRDIVSAAERLCIEGRDVIYLNIGDPQAFGYRPPDEVIEAVRWALRCRLTGYAHSAGILEAREAVAEYATRLGSPTYAKNVVMTNGASEAAELVLTALLDPGDEVLVPAPGYPLYPAIISKLAAVSVGYRLSQRKAWQPSVDLISAAISPRTKAIVLINPNNPTGSITSDEDTKRILQISAEKGLLVISDEVYRDLCFETTATPVSVLAKEMSVPVITLESLSKTHMLTGWRVGWMRFSGVEMMDGLFKAIMRLASGRLCSATASQYAVKPALEMDSGYRERFVESLRLRRDFAVSAINKIPGLECKSPDAAFYMMVRVVDGGSASDEEFVLSMLRHTGVLTVPGSGFGCDSRDRYFRMVYLANLDVLGTAISKISDFMSHVRREPPAHSRNDDVNYHGSDDALAIREAPSG